VTAFDDLDSYVALPRLSGLVLSPDGTRLVTSMATLDPTATKYVTSLWEVDPAGERPARRLTRSAKGEAGAAFLPSGDLLFTSARPDPEAKAGDDDEPAALWLLPAGGGEARVVAQRRAGVSDLAVARRVPVVVVGSGVLPHAADDEADEALRKDRKEKKVAAILHDAYPVRYWDHDLGPDAPHWFVGSFSAADDEPAAGSAPARVPLRDVTPDAGGALREQHAALSPDGATLVTGWDRRLPRADLRTGLVAIDVATGERRTLVADEGYDATGPTISPDGRWVAFRRETVAAPDRAPRVDLALVPLVGGEVRSLTAGWDRWPEQAVWLPGSDGLLVVADDDGRAPIFRVSLRGDVARATSDDAAFSSVQVAPDGGTAYAVRSSYAYPPHPVRIDLATGRPVAAEPLPAPAPLPELPGRLEEVETTGADGSRVRAWLALPHGASPEHKAPLLLWIHGGPLGSWNDWSWRWCPWLAVARGYAVLLPDPALSTGYGQDFVQRGWGAWGGPPFTDLMAATDAALARPDLDPGRTGAMGGSFGGYMANWVAGHTDRFHAIVTHASLWALDQFGPTTDAAFYWRQEMTPRMALDNSPHRHVADIRTPMLVVHGDRDYRVPIGEGLRLWYELLSSSGLPADAEGRSPHRFLYFPDENHWVLSPQHAAVWYGTVFAFLAEHVLGEPADYPRLLG
jgi:dipeptidyl aminopeptidase/acylaminoacyl peptidase